jgi:hypothetical protein
VNDQSTAPIVLTTNMPSPVINITIHKLNTMQFRHVGADHPIYLKIVEIARALASRDSVDRVVTPDEMLPSHASFLAILNATTGILEHSGLHLSRLDPLSRQKTICFSIDMNNMVVRDVTQGSEGIPDFPLPADEGVQNELKIFVTEQVNDWKKDEESRRQEQETKRKQEHERRRKNAIVSPMLILMIPESRSLRGKIISFRFSCTVFWSWTL